MNYFAGTCTKLNVDAEVYDHLTMSWSRRTPTLNRSAESSTKSEEIYRSHWLGLYYQA